MRRMLLVVTAVMLVLGAFTSTPRASAAVAAPARGGLSAVVTAEATLARTYSWAVDKVADAPVRSTVTSRTATFRYTVTARAGAATESGWAPGWKRSPGPR